MYVSVCVGVYVNVGMFNVNGKICLCVINTRTENRFEMMGSSK